MPIVKTDPVFSHRVWDNKTLNQLSDIGSGQCTKSLWNLRQGGLVLWPVFPRVEEGNGIHIDQIPKIST